MFNLMQRVILLIPFWMRATITEWLHPDTRCISYTFIEYPYSQIEIDSLDLEETTLHIHSDIIHKLAEEKRKELGSLNEY